MKGSRKSQTKTSKRDPPVHISLKKFEKRLNSYNNRIQCLYRYSPEFVSKKTLVLEELRSSLKNMYRGCSKSLHHLQHRQCKEEDDRCKRFTKRNHIHQLHQAIMEELKLNRKQFRSNRYLRGKIQDSYQARLS